MTYKIQIVYKKKEKNPRADQYLINIDLPDDFERLIEVCVFNPETKEIIEDHEYNWTKTNEDE